MAAHSKRARRLGAHLVFIDESGLLLSPLVRRTLAPKGETPVLLQQGRHRQKISLIGALTISPRRQRLGLYFSSMVNDSFDNQAVASFLKQLLRHLHGPIIVVWDRGPMHRGPHLRALQAHHPRLHFESLPAYAPDLNPVEQVWCYLKWGRLCNFAPKDVEHLQDAAHAELEAIVVDHHRLRKFWAGSELPMPRVIAS